MDGMVATVNGNQLAVNGKVFGQDDPLLAKARRVKLLLTDCDGVLTDAGVYYSDEGEQLKRFSVRDGMGVERLRTLVGIDVGIITGERSGSVVKRAEKLNISELHLGVKNKTAVLDDILCDYDLEPEDVAYIGDDTNDLGIMCHVGLSAAPVDAMPMVVTAVDYICPSKGGYGAFRDFAEFIIAAQTSNLEVTSLENTTNLPMEETIHVV
jgi:3-deoxy-D-manno-octulosonate 8-phosphate phosphatase (KDO 8-P phosphatase)